VSTVIKIKRSETPNQIPGASALAVHELAMNVTDGKLFTKTSGGVVKEVGGAGAVSLQTVTDGGAVTDNDITLNGANLIFEGYQENAYETTLTVQEPTADRTITFPDADGDVAMLGDSLAFSIVFGS
jgi:hypothetical protein|tara:strand:- start:135 stop:515 length:381 start_codon:yes stop_codon:yes gene_type:complete